MDRPNMSATASPRSHSNGRLGQAAPPHDADRPPLARSPYFAWKGLLDRLAAAVLLIPGLPMIGILIVLVRLSSRGPGVYRQARVGRGGRVFTMYKLRSMHVDAEARSGPTWAAPGKDPRVTPLGYWLRKLHLDELPQLFNVLLGEMSLIGPRPERPEFVDVLSRYIPEYHDRHTVAPGITGLAQINLPPDSDLDSVRRKVALDLEYVRTASLTLDVRMFLCTLLRMLGLRGDRAMRLMAVDRPIPHVQPTAGELHANGQAHGNVRLADLMQSLGLGAEASNLLAKARLESEQAERNGSVPATAESIAAGNRLAAEAVSR
jgi:lipopolysaccharide/colanic/teichoic acid biosynthesis glycosyltransferase